jgi:hypothetical protein
VVARARTYDYAKNLTFEPQRRLMCQSCATFSFPMSQEISQRRDEDDRPRQRVPSIPRRLEHLSKIIANR